MKSKRKTLRTWAWMPAALITLTVAWWATPLDAAPPPCQSPPERPSWYPVLGDTLLCEGFESGDGWTATDLLCGEPMWHRDSVEGGAVWRCSFPGGGYGDNWLQYLTTPPLEIPQGGRTFARMEVSYLTEPVAGPGGSDGMNLRASTDGGRSWELLHPHPRAHAYTSSDIRAFERLERGGFGAGWTGDSQGWRQVAVDLGRFAGTGVTLRLACSSDQWESRRDGGWMVRGMAVGDSAALVWQEGPEVSMSPSTPALAEGRGWVPATTQYHSPFQSYHCPWARLARCALESPYVDLRAYRRASLSYWYLLDLPDQDSGADGEWDDYYSVEISPDSGTTWHVLLCDADSLTPGPGWCRRAAEDVAAVRGTLFLDDWTGEVIKLRFVLRADDDSQGGGGLWLDDVMVAGARCSSLPGEILLSEFTASDTGWAIELQNRLTGPASLAGWVLELDGIEHVLPTATVVPAGGWLVLGPADTPDATVRPHEGTIRLLEPVERWQVDGVVYGTGDGAPAPVAGASVARVADAVGAAGWQWEQDLTPTLGGANDGPTPALGDGELRIVEIGLCPAGGGSLFVEALNQSQVETVCVDGWRVGVAGAAIPVRGTVPPGQSVAWWLVEGTEPVHRRGAAYLWNELGGRVDQVGWTSALLPSVSRGVPRGETRLPIDEANTEPTDVLVACAPTPGTANRVLLPPHGGLDVRRGGDVVELSWPPVADRILGFNVYRSTGGAERHEAPLNGDTPQVRTGFVDRQASPDSGYTYWLEVVYAPGESYLAEGVDVGAGAGTAHVVALGRAEPNPFEKRTTISLHVEEALEVDVSIYATGGRVVRSLMSGTQLPGTSRLEWDGTDEGGRRVPPGLYFCRAWWPGGTTSVKVLLLKGKTP